MLPGSGLLFPTAPSVNIDTSFLNMNSYNLDRHIKHVYSKPPADEAAPAQDHAYFSDDYQQKAFRRSADLDRHIKHVYSKPRGDQASPLPEYVCIYNGSQGMGFRRSADLDRHIKHVHLKLPDVSFCDYNRCPQRGKAVAASTVSTSRQPYETLASHSSSSLMAGTGGFSRKDHARVHYRDYHREDLCRRNS